MLISTPGAALEAGLRGHLRPDVEVPVVVTAVLMGCGVQAEVERDVAEGLAQVPDRIAECDADRAQRRVGRVREVRRAARGTMSISYGTPLANGHITTTSSLAMTIR